MNPFERKFREFAQNLTAKNAEGNAEHIAAKSSDVFADKPFTTEFATVYKIAQWGQSVAQVVTFLTTAALGVYVFQHIVPTWWGIYIAVPLGLLFSFGAEKAKRSTLAISSKHILKYRTFGLVGFMAMLAMCISIAAALLGSKELPGIVYPMPARSVDAGNVAALTADVDRVQKDIDRVQSNLRSEKNWIAENRTLPKLQKERAALVERRDAANNAAEGRGDAQHAEALADRAAKVDKMQVYSVGAAIVAELVFLLCTGFIFYYLFRHFAQTEHEAAEVDAAATIAQSKPVAQAVNGKSFAANLSTKPDFVHYSTAAPAPARDDSMSNGAMSNTVVIDSSMKPCAWCSTLYKPKTTWQKFCSTDCKLSENEHRVGTRFDPAKAKFKKKTGT